MAKVKENKKVRQPDVIRLMAEEIVNKLESYEKQIAINNVFNGKMTRAKDNMENKIELVVEILNVKN